MWLKIFGRIQLHTLIITFWRWRRPATWFILLLLLVFIFISFTKDIYFNILDLTVSGAFFYILNQVSRVCSEKVLQIIMSSFILFICSLPIVSTRTDLDAGVVEVRLASWWVGQQNVLGLEVPVDDPFGLEDPHGPCNLLQENPNSVLTQRAFGCRGTRGE